MKQQLHRVLLVDDDFDQQFLSQRALDKTISDLSTVHVVSSGRDAISYMIGEGRYADRARYPFPTPVITDLNMPDGDGFHVLEFMKCNQEWSVVPRIMFSSSDDDDDVRTAFLLGASAYHVKPADGGLDECMRQIITYWSGSKVPPVDANGRLLITSSVGKTGERYNQPRGSGRMMRPEADEAGAQPPEAEAGAQGHGQP